MLLLPRIVPLPRRWLLIIPTPLSTPLPFFVPPLPHTQVIVFSQWTGMLDLLEVPLKRNGYKYRRCVTGSVDMCGFILCTCIRNPVTPGPSFTALPPSPPSLPAATPPAASMAP